MLMIPKFCSGRICGARFGRRRCPKRRSPASGKTRVPRERLSLNQNWCFQKSESTVSPSLVTKWRWKKGDDRAALNEDATNWPEWAEWAESRVQTTGEAAKLTLQADRAQIAADGKDLSFVTVRVADQNGLMVPRSKNALQFRDFRPQRNRGHRQRRRYRSHPFPIERAQGFQRSGAGNCAREVRATSDGLESGEVVVNSGK